MTSFAEFKAEQLQDPGVRAEYERLGPIYELVGAMTEARHRAGLSQSEVAARMGTTQSVVARLENARHLPSLGLVTRYAAALGRKLEIKFVAAETDHSI